MQYFDNKIHSKVTICIVSLILEAGLKLFICGFNYFLYIERPKILITLPAMKTKLFLLCSIFFFQGFSQDIYSVLTLDQGLDIHPDTKVAQLTAITTSYDQKETQTEKAVTIINKNQQIVSVSHYNEKDSLKSKTSRTYDIKNNKYLSCKTENWSSLLGYSSEIENYKYDENGFLVKIIESNHFDIVMREVHVKNNTQGHPIALELKFPDGANSIVMETATYDYPNKKVTTKMIIKNDKILRQQDILLTDTQVKIEKTYGPDGKIVPEQYEYEFKYDQRQNWIEKTVYKLQNGQRTKYQVISREIKYTS